MMKEAITGLVLAGGQGSRMGGVDKGLQLLNGVPLALHALRRLQPQVSRVAISANRNLPVYAAWDMPVWTDATVTPGLLEPFAGPLAGFSAGLAQCETPYLVAIPCDVPFFPADLAVQLATALTMARAEAAYASHINADGSVKMQPVFCLMEVRFARLSLQIYLKQGGKSIKRWLAGIPAVEVPFNSLHAEPNRFANANTLLELEQLQLSAGLIPKN